LRRRAVRECLRRYASPGHALDPVVANRRRRAERFFNVTLLEHVAARGGVAPDTGIAVGLKLHPHRQVVALSRVVALELADLALRADERLHVMADLVREYVGLGEVAPGTKPARELVVEAEVDVDLAIGGAVE